jgi:hypothetical protein
MHFKDILASLVRNWQKTTRRWGQVNERKKSQKGFVAVTLITLLAIALVIVVYATLLATFHGGEVVVGTVAAEVWYSPTNGTTEDWTATLNVTGTTDPWYAKVNFTSAYTGDVQITWQLEKKNGNWANATEGTDASVTTVITTSFALDGTSGQTAYASISGDIDTNQNWGAGMVKQGSYRIVTYIDSKA